MRVIPFERLICPLCHEPLLCNEKSFCCDNGHSFDCAKQGQVNLLPVQQKRSRDPGDSKEMVQSRRDFLNQGLYLPLAEQLADLVCSLMAKRPSGAASSEYTLLDAGCGEGYYLSHIADKLSVASDPSDVALCGVDISKWAVLAAAKRRKDIRWLVASNKALPVAPHSIDLIVCGFGFHCYSAFHQALKPGGTLVLIDPAEQHLLEIREIIYPQLKPFAPPSNAMAEQAGFILESDRSYQFTCQLSTADQIEQLLSMTPHLHRAPRGGVERLLALSSLKVTIDAQFRCFVSASA